MTEDMQSGPDSYFLSCDWGTSSFRLRLVETHTLRVIGELKNNEGIAATFRSWASSEKPASERLAFYRSILEAQIAALQNAPITSSSSIPSSSIPSSSIPSSVTSSPITPAYSASAHSSIALTSLSGIPLIISGMASSSIGMRELPYKELPFNTNGEDLQVAIFEATELYPRQTLLLSGVRSTDDVMRGEETQLIGCFPIPEKPVPAGATPGVGERIFIFPGTHSKHVWVRNGKAVGLRTYMTGEYFHLLTRHSILAGSVAESTGPIENSNPPESLSVPESQSLPENLRPPESLNPPPGSGARPPFEQGVLDSINTNLLHQSFQVRTRHLLGTLSKEDNYHYLSGLLIGSECKDLVGSGLPLTLVCGDALQHHYTRALHTLGITDVALQALDQAVLRAHARLRKSFLGK